MEIVPFNFLRITERRQSVVGGTRGARASSMVCPVDEYQLFICALGVVVNYLADNYKIVAAML